MESNIVEKPCDCASSFFAHCSTNTATRDYSKGKSFRFRGKWTPDETYENNDFFQDFVNHEGLMYVCLNNTQSEPTDISEDWIIAGATTKSNNDSINWSYLHE